MTKKALLALCLAILLPAVSYLILKTASDNAVTMPRKFFYDSVTLNEKNGKKIYDTSWHITSNITLVNQLGDTVSLYDLKDKIKVIDLFFTHCRSICPLMTKNMQRLQHSFILGGDQKIKIDTSIVQFISITIDPQRDSTTVLKDYADRFGAKHETWWFLTGDRKIISDFAFKELKVDQYTDSPVDSDFVHTSRFIVLDTHNRVRGFYNGLDTSEMKVLAKDIGILMLEKDPTKKGEIFKEIMSINWLIAIIVSLVALFIFFLIPSYNNKK